MPRCWGSGGRTRRCLEDYARGASVHGVKYVAHGNRRVADKVFWVAVLLLSLGLCSHQIYKAWHKWMYTPVKVSFDEKTTPVWDIPFPAVTICSEIKARHDKFNYTEAKRKYDSGSQDDDVHGMLLLCRDKKFTKGKLFATTDVIQLYRKMCLAMKDMIKEASWCQVKRNVREIFTPIVLREGICFSFNMLDPREIFTNITEQYKYKFTYHGLKADNWSTDSGYAETAPAHTYPRRALDSGFSTSLVVLLRTFDEDIEFVCQGPVPGFRVLLHNPSELPWMSQNFLRSDLNQELVVSVRPYMMTTNKGLEKYSPYVRQCFFPSERQLKYFKVYTQNNCQQECLADFTLELCGCVGFFMPRTANMKICSSGKRTCMTDAAEEMVRLEVERGLSGSTRGGLLACDCLPSCTEVHYDVETSTAKFSWKKMVVSMNKNLSDEEFDGANIGRVVVFFKDSQFIRHIRKEVFGATEFWANCGGLLGLFLGMSVLSFLEIIYFFTVRLWVHPSVENNGCCMNLGSPTTDRSL